MLFSDVISLFDTTETEEGLVVLQYIISGVSVDCSKSSVLSKEMEKPSNTVTIYIPDTCRSEETYVSPITWGSLDFSEKLSHFTFRPGQVICLLSDYIKIDSVDDLFNKYDHVYRVIGVDRFNKLFPHFEVICK